jgi:myo-inositol-1-phosphate synthase
MGEAQNAPIERPWSSLGHGFFPSPKARKSPMSVRETPQIDSAAGKLGVLLPGLGAVSTTFIAGVEAIRKGLTPPIGSLTQMSRIRLGKRTEDRNPMIKDFVPLAGLDQLVFGGWDIYEDNCYEAALNAGVLSHEHQDAVKPLLESIKPMKAVFEQRYVQRITGPNVKEGGSKADLAAALMQDIKDFQETNQTDRCVMVWCGSTEIFQKAGDVHSTLEKFEAGLAASHPDIAPSQIYAYAAIKSGVPFANGAPNLTVDAPAIIELAKREGVPIAGKDYKSGQTFMKTLLAPGLKARMLGLSGWFSGNILGNRDGEVLDEPANFKTKEDSKLSALDVILQPQYYPDFLCRDSILAAPLVLDLALFMDLAKRSGMSGIQEWLSFYFKSPMAAKEIYPEHDIFIQLMKMKNTLRWMKGEDLITHLGLEYYD